MAKGNFSSKKKQFTCHYCKKPGHLRRTCRDYRTRKVEGSVKPKHQSHQPGRRESQDAMLITHAQDHVYRDEGPEPQGECDSGRWTQLGSSWNGTVDMEMLLPNGGSRMCALKNVLYIPKLAYNLVSVSKAARRSNSTTPHASLSTAVTRLSHSPQGKEAFITLNFSGGSHRRVSTQLKPGTRKGYGTDDLGT